MGSRGVVFALDRRSILGRGRGVLTTIGAIFFTSKFNFDILTGLSIAISVTYLFSFRENGVLLTVFLIGLSGLSEIFTGGSGLAEPTLISLKPVFNWNLTKREVFGEVNFF